MDSSVVPSKKYKDLFIVSTTDFFYPNVQDPYQQGRIACCNVLSDMYAMGVYEIDNVLMLLATSSDMIQTDREIVTKLMMKGFDDTCKEAGTQVSGGQSIVNPWPIIGGVAKSICKKEDIIMPVGAQVGDVIVLTKPLGTQIAVNVKQWMSKDDECSTWNTRVQDAITKEEGNRAYFAAMASMGRLNKNGAQLMHKYGAHAATDVTGFGIIGHSRNLVSNQEAKVSFVIHTLPIISGMVAVAKLNKGFKLLDGLSAETSGGLFVCLPKDKAAGYCKELEELDGKPAWIIGDVIAGEKTSTISESVKVLEV
jgi:selenide,water dikinase